MNNVGSDAGSSAPPEVETSANLDKGDGSEVKSERDPLILDSSSQWRPHTAGVVEWYRAFWVRF
jgi:hypothetical protein